MAMEKIIFIGKPNSGKSSLFNQLTGLNQKTGNFSGVTVEQKKGRFQDFEITDLPGLQSLQSTNLDEQISKRELFKLTESDKVVFIANGMQLEESLLFFSQIADLQIPILLAINFKDEIEKNGVEIKLDPLSKQLGCSTIIVNARTGDGIEELKQLIKNNGFRIPNSICRSQYDEFSENGDYKNNYRILSEKETNSDFWESDYFKRKEVIQNIAKECTTKPPSSYLSKTQRLDKWLLHPIIGVFIFLFIMFLVFQGVFSFAEYPMGLIDDSFSSLADMVGSKFLKAIIIGLGAIMVFIPPIAILFFLLGILEHTGYLSRISFIADAFLKKFGLSGHSVVPLMSSWACAIPAIMSTRIITNPRERFAVIMASPLMTCSARLPVYAILIIVIFPEESSFWGIKGLTLLSLYLLGLVATLMVAWLVNKNSKIPSSDNWILELPVFRKPNWKSIFINVYQKTKAFVVQAGKIILVISVLLFILSETSPKNQQFVTDKIVESQENTPANEHEAIEKNIELEYSYLGYMGKGIEPLVRPLGYDWKIGIALISSFAAREVFASTLVTIYSLEEVTDEEDGVKNTRIADKFRADLIKQGKEPNVTAISVSLLLFYVFAMQCMSTLAIVRRETNSWYYAIVQFLFMLLLAYGFAFIAYQLLKI
jgi:ferrous iron transport protein B